MGSKGGFTLLGLLIILSVLCDSGHSLQCYTCLNPGGACTLTTNCTVNFDACLYVKAETRTYYQCWKFQNCNYEYLSKNLGEKTLQYECCQKDLCNRSGGTSITGTMALLVAPLLTAFWRLLI
ncbi:CD59 glycoprotein-like [Myotis myotis]|uniref:CD59 glycoprotein n=1 Tax=Myotis myotis TaxID=51298 RepID=A0A7J7VGB1_MYOMY|nr:CD59 glycoprotein-like [Myotis myotis]KAF6324243.1 CD59 molecule (CD59 blood group) [Myotis myotis]KAF6324245.1 CD59 molecule (CD59 blood group) [Myotis myotis]